VFQGSLVFNDNYGFLSRLEWPIPEADRLRPSSDESRLRENELPLTYSVVMACTRKTLTFTGKFIFLFSTLLRQNIFPTHPAFLYTSFTVTENGQYWRFPTTYLTFGWVRRKFCELIFATEKIKLSKLLKCNGKYITNVLWKSKSQIILSILKEIKRVKRTRWTK
jgi:hypothetical protein